jgi:hypothetical protein
MALIRSKVDSCNGKINARKGSEQPRRKIINVRNGGAWGAQVPRNPPATREQWRAWCAHWPISWRPPEAARAVAGPEAPPPAEQAAMEAAMRHAWRLALCNAAGGGGLNAAVVVDPATGGAGGLVCPVACLGPSAL